MICYYMYVIIALKYVTRIHFGGELTMTTSDIAKKLGVSRGTVSRVLNNHPNVKDETRKKIQAELDSLNYTPHEAARLLVRQRSYKIAVIVFSEPKFFWERVEHGVKSASAELAIHGVTVDYFVTDILNPQEQLDLLKGLPSQGYDAIAVAPNAPTLLVEEIDTLSATGMPVVLINVDIPTANRVCYVGCNYTQSGVLAAEILAKSLKSSGKIIMLALKDQVIPIDQRITGFRGEISRYSGVSIEHVLRFNRKAEGVYDAVKDYLSTKPATDGIYVGFGALEQTAQAVIDSGMLGKISVVGYDLSEDIYDYIKQGAITATISHEPFNQGYFAVKILHNYLCNNLVPSSTILYCKLEAIFSANARNYLNEQEHVETILLHKRR